MATPWTIGWEEWLGLPELGLPAIKAKIDTGARTSALHAASIEVFGPESAPKVRFAVHPVPGRDDIEVICVADVIDRRDVTSSNGERETRVVIRSVVRMGERTWPIEITLTNRDAMAYRMLLGRQAIQDDMVVDPAASFLQPRLSYRHYAHLAAAEPRDEAGLRAVAPAQPLSIVLLTRRPDNTTNRRLVREAARRGHTMHVIDRTQISLFVDAKDPAVFVDGRPLTGVDAVVIRSGRVLNSFSLAIVRQFEILGATAINPASALAITSDPLAERQCLARAGIPIPEAAVSHGDLLKAGRPDSHVLADSLDALAAWPLVRFAIVGGRAFGAIERSPVTALDEDPEWRTIESPPAQLGAARELASRAAKAIGLGFASIDIALARRNPIVVAVAANPGIAEIERLSGAAIIEAVLVHLELEARTRSPRPTPA